MDGLWPGVVFCYSVSANATAGGSRLGMGKFECVTIQQSVHVELDSVTALALLALATN